MGYVYWDGVRNHQHSSVDLDEKPMTNKKMFEQRKAQENYWKTYFEEIDRKLREKIQSKVRKR